MKPPIPSPRLEPPDVDLLIVLFRKNPYPERRQQLLGFLRDQKEEFLAKACESYVDLRQLLVTAISFRPDRSYGGEDRQISLCIDIPEEQPAFVRGDEALLLAGFARLFRHARARASGKPAPVNVRFEGHYLIVMLEFSSRDFFPADATSLLGLAVAKRILEAQGATVCVDNSDAYVTVTMEAVY